MSQTSQALILAAHSTDALESIIRRVDEALPRMADIRGLHDVLLDIRLDAQRALKPVPKETRHAA